MERLLYILFLDYPEDGGSKLLHITHNKLPTKTVSYARRFFKTSVQNNAHGTFQGISQLWPILCSPVGNFSWHHQVWELWACPEN